MILHKQKSGASNERGDFAFNGVVRPLNIVLSGGTLYFRFSSATHHVVPPGRVEVSGFSESSRGRMRRFLRGCVPEFRTMVTLTYPAGFPSDGRTVKRHLRAYMERCRRMLGDRAPDESAFWFLEFQGRGAPHFHLFQTFDVPRETLARWWYEIVNSDDDRHLRAGTRIERITGGRNGCVSYANKYAAKSEQKQVPIGYEHVGRFWGVCFNRETVSAATKVGLWQGLGMRTMGALDQLKATIKAGVVAGNIRKHKPNGRATVYFIRDLESQRSIREQILSVSFFYQMETCGNRCFSTPLQAEDRAFPFGEAA